MEFTPALKGKMGDWNYYVTMMKFGEVANRIKFAHELHPHAELDEQIQRELSDRVEIMVNYLVAQNQHFYGALIVAVYGGEPRFDPVNMAEHPLLDTIDTPFGLLRFDGTQRYFALDGQHRLASIKAAIDKKPEIASEEISVILVPHFDTKEGLQRTRRLFTTVNRYAKPIAKHTGIIMDEDDPIAISTRYLVRDFPLFSGALTKIKGSSVGQGEKKVLTTLSTLYLCSEDILAAEGFKISKESKQYRPDDEELDRMNSVISTFWTKVCAEFGEIAKVAKGENLPGDFRGGDNPGTGSLLFKPVGQLVLSSAYLAGRKAGMSQDVLLSRLSRINWKLEHAPWKGVVWRGEKMVTTGEAITLASKLCGFIVGVPIPDEHDLLVAYRKTIEDSSAALPGKID